MRWSGTHYPIPRTGLLFAHKTQRTHRAKGTGGGAQKRHSKGTTRQAHTQRAPPSRPYRGEGDAHLHGKQMHAPRVKHTHTQGL